MSPVFIENTNKMCHSIDSTSIPAIALNNTQIRTLINIYPPNSNSFPSSSLSQNIPINPFDLRKHHSSTIAAQNLYHHYFSHLLALQNQQQTQQNLDREIKRPTNSKGKRDNSLIRINSYGFCLKNQSSYKNEKQIFRKNVLILLN